MSDGGEEGESISQPWLSIKLYEEAANAREYGETPFKRVNTFCLTFCLALRLIIFVYSISWPLCNALTLEIAICSAQICKQISFCFSGEILSADMKMKCDWGIRASRMAGIDKIPCCDD
jgi:hypothetical protein